MPTTTTKKPAAPKAAADKKPQPPWLRKKAALPAPVLETPPTADPVRLLSKADVVRITGTSFVSIWTWMRRGAFPRSRIVGGRSMWLSSEIAQWLAQLPLRELKGDAAREDGAQ